MEVIAPPARRVLERLERAGYEAYLVGGCVRDLLLDRRPGDWDITTAARPEEVLSLFAPQAAATGLKHGTVTVFEGAASFRSHHVPLGWDLCRSPAIPTLSRSLTPLPKI